MEGTDIQSAFVRSNSTEILDRGRVSSVAQNNYNELEKLLFKLTRFDLKPYEFDYSQTEAKKSPPTATPCPKQLSPYPYCCSACWHDSHKHPQWSAYATSVQSGLD